jgi:GAF domain-containing protein
MINEAGMIMNSTLDIDLLLDRILSLVHRVFSLDHCAILLIDRDCGELIIRKAVGYNENVVKKFRGKVGMGITGWVAQNGIPLSVADVKKDPRYIKGVNGAVSEMAVPLIFDGAIIGVLDAECTKKRFFSKEDLEMFMIFASQAATALHNARLYHELNMLYRTAQNITSILDIDRVLEEILTASHKVLHFHSCAVLLAGDNGDLEVCAAFGYPEEIIGKLRIPLGYGITGRAALSGKPVLIPDVTLEKDYIPGITGGKCEMAVPLKARGKLLGVLDAESTCPSAFDLHDLELFETFAAQASIAIENARMILKTQDAYYETIRSLAEALEARDSYTKGHSERVTKYALLVAEKMGLPEREKNIIAQSGLLHDIGKIGISDIILNKPSVLSSEERKTIEDHPKFGDTILSHMKFLEKALAAILHHHERYDGTGYPARLKGKEIPLIARIIAVTDAYDAMTSERPYRAPMSQEEVIRELKQSAGTQLDPDVVDVFFSLVDEGKITNA